MFIRFVCGFVQWHCQRSHPRCYLARTDRRPSAASAALDQGGIEFIDEKEEVPAFDYESRHAAKVASKRPKQIWLNEAKFLNRIQRTQGRVAFIDENGGGPGVRLRKSSIAKARK
jgi:hypothetical protein